VDRIQIEQVAGVHQDLGEDARISQPPCGGDGTGGDGVGAGGEHGKGDGNQAEAVGVGLERRADPDAGPDQAADGFQVGRDRIKVDVEPRRARRRFTPAQEVPGRRPT
jgi:hypothetical protein